MMTLRVGEKPPVDKGIVMICSDCSQGLKHVEQDRGHKYFIIYGTENWRQPGPKNWRKE